MSSTEVIESGDDGLSQSPPGVKRTGQGLVGHLGTADLVLAALAFAGPLAGTAGYITIIIAAGNGIGAPGTFIAVMAVLLLFSVGYGAMTRSVPNPGAFYAYITAGLGRRMGLGSSFLILASYVAIGVGFYGFAGLAVQGFVVSHGGPDIPWWVFSLMFWVLVGTLAYFRVDVSAKVLGILLVCEVVVVVAFDIAVFSQGGATGISFEPFTPAAFTSGHLGIALVFGVALFTGFEATAIYREETRNPNKTIPRATKITVLLIGIFYTITSWALITGLGTSNALDRATEDPAGAFFAVATQFGGPLLSDAANLLLVTSILAAHLAIQNVTTRYTWSLAVDGILPATLGKAHPRFQSPHRASMTVSFTFLILTGFLVVVGLTAEEIYAWFAGAAAFTIMVAMTLTSLAAVFYFRKNPEPGLSKWKSSIAPSIAFAALAVMVVLGIINFPSLIGGSQLLANIMLLSSLLIFVIGVVTAEILRRKNPNVYQRIGRQ
ncbi:Amino acid transporter [Arthrobacter sp. 49Tsu3.1M3]|uniref:APC family permease n=1 Tax=Arthrobacter sp. 49Tsu3.1M3 TaxID=1279029 RepID=UPI0009A6FCE4|nr:APC family permease [Arthrobacter sp. 49Tsu3.1M3]SKB44082.1 Amino acid transporter [Arthrobacter sp. 49Tsu3.1M3]